jgi:CheY-like chemotaxis protein
MASQKKILVADDERPLANALKLKLEKEGYLVTTCFDGKEAVSALNGGHFDLVLLDLVMPEADGFFVLQKIKDMEINVPVVVSSNLSQEEDLDKAKAMGAVDYFVKSDTPISDIIETVKKYMK